MPKIITLGEKGLTKEDVKLLSQIKKEPKWMLNFRLQSYQAFMKLPLPDFGPPLKLNFDKLTYYKKIDDQVHSDWQKVPPAIKNIFNDLGLIEAEQKYLAGISTQIESEVIYHNMIKELAKKNIIFVDTDTALKKYPALFKKYFNKLVKYNENKFTALNTAVWSGGAFIYMPPYTKLDRPLQSYFRINTKNLGQFERTIIILDEGSELEYIEGCTAPTYTTDSLHAAVVEIYVAKKATCRYITIQNWAFNIYNLVTKRAIVEEDGLMEWIDGNIGSSITMKYPAIILNGANAKGSCLSIALAQHHQYLDTGAKMIHLAPNTKSNIIAKSISAKGGKTIYRGTVYIDKKATNAKSKVECDTLLLDSASTSDTIPKNIMHNHSSLLEHEATISKLEADKLFYLMSRGISREKAIELIVLGFTSRFKEKLPLEYSVELNNLLKMNII